MSSEVSPNLFLAILAMDAYNRGYGQGIIGLSSSGNIGNATIIGQSNISPESDEIAAGFYAIAYDMTGVPGFSAGETVISYRGTDNNGVDPFGNEGSDFVNGYALALGDFTAPQASLALDFHKAVVGIGGGVSPFGTNVITTGHSLGGGLAGFVARLYGLTGTVLGNAPSCEPQARWQTSPSAANDGIAMGMAA